MAVKVAGSYNFTIGDTSLPDISKDSSFDTGTIVDSVAKKVLVVSAGTLTLSIPSTKGSFLHIKAYDASGDPAAFTLNFNSGTAILPQFTEVWLNLDDYDNTPVYMTAVDVITAAANTTVEYEMASV